MPLLLYSNIGQLLYADNIQTNFSCSTMYSLIRATVPSSSASAASFKITLSFESKIFRAFKTLSIAVSPSETFSASLISEWFRYFENV